MILVTGPDGFVGNRVCRELLRRNHPVRGAQWKAGPIQKGCESIVVGNIGANTNWQVALRGVDTVVHLAARVHVTNDTANDPLLAFREVNVAGTMRLAECAVEAGVRRFIFVSTIKVNGETTCGKPFSENDTARPEDPYGVSKWEAEQILREIEAGTGMSVTILRPPLLYGPGVKANFLKLIKLIDKGIPIPLGSVNNRRSLMGLGNCADLICHCIEHPAARGETFVVSDGQDMSTAELIKKIGSALGKKPLLVPVPAGLLRGLGRIVGGQSIIRRLVDSLEIDSSKVRSVLSWRPPYSVEQELNQTAAWYASEVNTSVDVESTKQMAI
jgi:UDP-glucose 4-epimerase